MQTITVELGDDLVGQLQEKARSAGVSMDQLIENAVRLLIDSDRRAKLAEEWGALSSWGQQQAEALGVSEEDVPRLIAETRRRT